MAHDDVLPCHLMFGTERAEQIQAQMLESIGRPCPCLMGEPCLFLPLPERRPAAS